MYGIEIILSILKYTIGYYISHICRISASASQCQRQRKLANISITYILIDVNKINEVRNSDTQTSIIGMSLGDMRFEGAGVGRLVATVGTVVGLLVGVLRPDVDPDVASLSRAVGTLRALVRTQAVVFDANVCSQLLTTSCAIGALWALVDQEPFCRLVDPLDVVLEEA